MLASFLNSSQSFIIIFISSSSPITKRMSVFVSFLLFYNCSLIYLSFYSFLSFVVHIKKEEKVGKKSCFGFYITGIILISFLYDCFSSQTLFSFFLSLFKIQIFNFQLFLPSFLCVLSLFREIAIEI